ncbi:hypothetical protein [Streptomyces cucumeris]|uniref:hypothetical protein n=1 Tax=Streptomyces cucumeris TaxID=2962890 RepID=UPI003D721009
MQPTIHALAVTEPNCPAELRAWAADRSEHREVQEHIKGGHPLFAKFPDEDCTYTLSVWPSQMDEGLLTSPPEPMRHRIGGLSHPLYVLAEDPWRHGAGVAP